MENLERILELSGINSLNETFVNTSEVETDEDILRLSIVAELDAISLYKKFANKTKNLNIKKVLSDIAEEEEVHVGELERLLKDINPKYVMKLKKGEREVKKMFRKAEKEEEVL
jgi:rubrerythrin